MKLTCFLLLLALIFTGCEDKYTISVTELRCINGVLVADTFMKQHAKPTENIKLPTYQTGTAQLIASPTIKVWCENIPQ